MANILSKILLFSISSFSVVALVYYQIKIIQLQQIILLLIAVLIVVLRLLKNSAGKKFITDWLLIFIITFFLQLLIAATGAIFSPFFILVHLYVIGLSLFFNFWTAFSFLAMEVGVLILNISLDQNLLHLVKQDLGSVLLYFSSILVITPVSKFISQQYHIKTDTLKTLLKELNTQESIIEQIGDFVFTTDKNLTVLSANDSAQKNFDSSKINNISITDLLALTDEKGKLLSKEVLFNSLSPVINRPSVKEPAQNSASDGNRLNLEIRGYTLALPNKKTPLKVTIRVNPIISQEGTLEKLIFLISQIADKSNWTAYDVKLQQTHRKFLSVLNSLRKDPIISKFSTIDLYLQILGRYENDLLISSELNLSSTPLKVSLVDVFRLLLQTIEQEKSFAQKLNVNLKLNVPEELQEEYLLQRSQNSLPEYLIEPSVVSAVTDPRFVRKLLEKTTESVVSFASFAKNSLVEVEIAMLDDAVKLTVKTKISSPSDEKIQQVLAINSGNFEVFDNLALSSSLESYIIKNIVNILDISFTTEYNKYSSQLIFDIIINKYLK